MSKLFIFEASEGAQIEENAHFGPFLKGLEWAILVILAIFARLESPKITQNCQNCLKLQKFPLFEAKSEAWCHSLVTSHCFQSHFLALSQTLTAAERLSNVCIDHFSWFLVFFELDNSKIPWFLLQFLKKEKVSEQRAKSILEKIEDLNFFEFCHFWMVGNVDFSHFGHSEGWKLPKIAEIAHFEFENCLKIDFLVIEWRKVELKKNTESFYTGVLLSFGMCLLWHFLERFGSLCEKCW